MRTSSKSVLASAAALAAILGIVSTTAHAAPQTKSTQTQQSYANIDQGDLNVSGSLSFNSYWYAGRSQSSTFSLGVLTQYFVVDRFALGVSGSLNTSSGNTNFWIGPIATYFFWSADRLAAYVSQAAQVQAYSAGGQTASTAILTTQLGLDFFITPSVAIGPAVQYFHGFGTTNYIRVDEFSFLGGFSIFL